MSNLEKNKPLAAEDLIAKAQEIQGGVADIFQIILDRTKQYHPESFDNPDFKKQADEMQKFIDKIEGTDSEDNSLE